MELKRQILVVDDTLINREILAEILKEKYTVLQAENGKEALDTLKKNKEEISLILLDINMPVMDGYTFLNIIKEDAELALIPVIVMTQSDSEDDEVSALEHGATDFVPKPYRPRVILNRVESLIKLRETSAVVNQFQYDRLTGLYGKEFFYKKVRERLMTNPEQKCCIVCLNIENFKLYNDTFGVKAGDLILKEISAMTKKMNGNNGFCGRFGADRFLCFREGEWGQEDHKNLEYVKRHTSLHIKNVVVRWGIYEITDCSTTVEQMCDRAFLAADSIKGQYNKIYAIYDDELRSKILREKAITDAMEIALTNKQFEVCFQPKYSLKNKCMIGAEALVRWKHPELGLISPGEFIPLFEKNGFISKLDRYVWEQVCAHLRDWKEKGYQIPVISVNVSRADIYQLDLEKILLKITQKYDVEPTYLHIEITESAYAENPIQIISTVKKLRKLGFIVELDDFGSGYSSLNMLSRIKLDILKLDMKFIQNEIAKPEQSILNDIINMAHRIHLSVVAEGVETRVQLEKLLSMGCDYAQGYYFAKPMSIEEFEELWINQRGCFADNLIYAQQNDTDLSMLLVVDENAAYRDKIRQAFVDQFEVLEADDADSALSYIKSYGQGKISAIILSMSLPGDGAVSVMKVMHQEPTFWDIPILATIPSSASMEEFQMAYETDDFLCKCHPVIDLRRRVQHLLELMALRKQKFALQNEACRDYLTGLLNRRGFMSAIDSLRAENFPIAVCFFDLDDLKKVNDTYGHDAGDCMLRNFAEYLGKQTSANDIRCRYGGDEFAVIMKNVNDVQTAAKKCQVICRGFREYVLEDKFSSGCSCGIALCVSGEEPFDNVIERADKSLYHAKQENKGNYCLWED